MKTQPSRALVAILALAALGCGDDGGGAAADAMTEPDATPIGTCGLQVGLLIGDPVGDVVAFNAPDGTLLGTAAIDDTGVASYAGCVDDTTVTWIRPGTGMDSIMGVDIGVTARWGTLDGLVPNRADVTITGFKPRPNAATTVASYNIYVNCEEIVNATPATTQNVTSRGAFCFDNNPDDIDVIVVAIGNTTNRPIDYIYAKDIPEVRPETVVDLTSATWESELGLGASAGSVMLEGFDPETMRAELFELVDGARYRSTPNPDSIAVTDGSGSYLAELFDDDKILEGIALRGIARYRSRGISSRVEYRAANAARDIDFTTLLPPVSHGVVSAVDPTRPTVQWLIDGELDRGEGSLLSVSWDNPDGSRARWLLLTNRTTDTTLQLPELPGDAGDVAPREGSTYERALVALFHHDWITYDELVVDGSVFPQLLLFGDGLTATSPPTTAITELSISSALPAGGPIIIE